MSSFGNIYIKIGSEGEETTYFMSKNALKTSDFSEFLVKKAAKNGTLYAGSKWEVAPKSVFNERGEGFNSMEDVVGAGYSARAVRDCLARKQHTADGMTWAVGYIPDPAPPRPPQNRRARFEVIGYPIDGAEPVRFNVRSEVLLHPMGYRVSGIDACLHGRTKRYKDCIWKYPDDPAPSASEIESALASLPPHRPIVTDLGERFDSIWAAARLGFAADDVLESIATGKVRHDRVWSYD